MPEHDPTQADRLSSAIDSRRCVRSDQPKATSAYPSIADALLRRSKRRDGRIC
jgi:hypothetical protein